jgi:hypothetical protein
MKIKIMREGGFIGITSKANLEFDKLTEAEQNAFNALANQTLQKDKTDDKLAEKSVGKEAAPTPIASKLGTFQAIASPSKVRNLDTPPPPPQPVDNGLELAGMMPPQSPGNGMMCDGFQYSISMKKDGKTLSMKFDDGNAPAEIVEIFQKYVQY